MFEVTLKPTEVEEELIEIAELVRQACWKAATSASSDICQQYVRSTSGLVTSVDFKDVSPATAYDATALTLYWLVFQLVAPQHDASDAIEAIMNYIADGISIREALELYARTLVNS